MTRWPRHGCRCRNSGRAGTSRSGTRRRPSSCGHRRAGAAPPSRPTPPAPMSPAVERARRGSGTGSRARRPDRGRAHSRGSASTPPASRRRQSATPSAAGRAAARGPAAAATRGTRRATISESGHRRRWPAGRPRAGPPRRVPPARRRNAARPWRAARRPPTRAVPESRAPRSRRARRRRRRWPTGTGRGAPGRRPRCRATGRRRSAAPIRRTAGHRRSGSTRAACLAAPRDTAGEGRARGCRWRRARSASWSDVRLAVQPSRPSRPGRLRSAAGQLVGSE